MTIAFELNIPDEPFKDTYNLEKKVTVTYTAPRYIVISVFKETSQVSTWLQAEDELTDIDLLNFNEEGKTFIIIDAQEHPLIASFVTGSYTNEEIPNFAETLPTGEIYEYAYSNSILSSIYAFDMPTYDPSTETFGSLRLLTSATTNEDFYKKIDATIAEVESDPSIGVHRTANQELNQYLEDLRNLKTLYKDVDYWKIPYPIRPA